MNQGTIAVIVVADDANLTLEYVLSGLVAPLKKGIIKEKLFPEVFVFPEHALRKEDITSLLASHDYVGMGIVGGGDRSLPELLLGASHANISTVVVTPGVQNEKQEGPGLSPEMGIAQALCIVIEALGLSVPFSALVPARSSEEADLAYKAGRVLGSLVASDINFNALVTLRALENAAKIVHSCQADMPHVKEALESLGWKKRGYKTPLLLDCLPKGQYPLNYFWWAGGVMLVASELDDALSLNEMNISGHTLGDIIREFRASKSFGEESKYLRKRGLVSQDIIHPALIPLSEIQGDEDL